MASKIRSLRLKKKFRRSYKTNSVCTFFSPKIIFYDYFSIKILLTFFLGPYSSRAPFSVIGEMDLGPVHGPEGNFFCAIALRLLPSLSNVLGKFMIYVSVFHLCRFVCLYVFLCLSACLSFKMYLKSS